MTEVTDAVAGLAARCLEDKNVQVILADALEEAGEERMAATARALQMDAATLGKLASRRAVTPALFREVVDRHNAEAHRPRGMEYFVPHPWTLDDVLEYDLLPDAVVAAMGSDLEFPLDPGVARQFWNSPRSGDGFKYLVYPDGSLWYVNNADNEVWADAGDFADKLANDIRENPPRGQDEWGRTDEPGGWADVNETDREFLTWAYDTEADAMEACGFEVTDTTTEG